MSLLQTILVPRENVNDEFIIVNSLYFKNGDKIKKGDSIVSIETSKADFTVESEFGGYVHYHCKEGDELPIGNVIADVFDSEHDTKIETKTTPGKQAITPVVVRIEPEFTKSALELMSELKIEKAIFGNKNFVTKNDVLAFVADRSGKDQAMFIAEPFTPEVKQNVSVEKVSSFKRREISYLGAGQNDGLTCNFSINIDNRGLLDYARKHHTIFRLTIVPTILLEISKLLEKFPILNSYYANNEIVTYHEVNVGYALDIDQGLKVVTLHNSNKLSIKDLETTLQSKIDRYSKKALDVSDISNSTITITDLSKSGIHYFQPLINKNQCAIIGISSVDFTTNMFNISITFDHRVTEGRVVAAFLSSLKKSIEKLPAGSYRETNRQKIQKLNEKVNFHAMKSPDDSNNLTLIVKELIETLLR